MADDPSVPTLVLVVDDEAVLRFLATDTLEDHGYRVIEAEDAGAALKLLAEHPDVRVLFTDVNMPGAIDGLALAREVHARWPAIKLIVTSGRLNLSSGEIPDAGHFVPKPYSPDALLEHVGEALAGPRGKTAG